MYSSRTALILALTLVTGLAGVPAIAAEPDAAEVKKAVDAHNATVADPGEQLVCHKEAVTGSRIRKTVCRTQKTIEADAEAAKRYLNKPRPVQYQD